jgi:hypothetical protein
MKFMTAAAAATGAALLLAGHTKGRLVHPEWAIYLVLPLAAAALLWYVDRKRESAEGDDPDLGPAAALLVTMALFLISSAVTDTRFFLSGWSPPGGAGFFRFQGGLARAALLTAILTPLCLYTGRRRWLFPLLLFLVLQFVTLGELHHSTGWTALYRDDHPSFMFRFWSYARSFPHLVSYDPYWNGGKAATYLISSGIMPMGLLFLPLWRMAPVLKVYTPVIGFTFIVLLPWIAAGSARLAGAGRQAALCAGILALGFCWHFYTYLVNYGTVGSIFNTFFLLPVVAVLYRVLWLDRREIWAGALLVLSSVFFLSWPGSAFVAPFIVAGVLLSAGQWTKKKVLFILVCSLLIVAALAPMYLSLHQHANLAKFSSADGALSLDLSSLGDGWHRMQRHFRQANPLVLFFGIGGLFFLRRRGWIPLLVPFVAGAALVSGWGEEWKPILQLGRTAIPLFLVAVLPAGLLCGDILDTRGRRWAAARAAILVLLLMGGLAGAAHYRHFAEAGGATISPVMEDVIAWLQENTDGESRILFAGQTVHGYGAGHVALLPAVTGREMMASDYYAFSPKLVEYEYPPREWRSRGHKGVREFFELFNVGYVVTYHDKWKEYFRRRPRRYGEMSSFMQKTLEITVFRVERERSWFLKGSGSVKAEFNRLQVRPDSPGEMVLKYRWEDGLAAGPGIDLYPVEAGEGVLFVGAKSEEPGPFTIRYGGLF